MKQKKKEKDYNENHFSTMKKIKIAMKGNFLLMITKRLHFA